MSESSFKFWVAVAATKTEAVRSANRKGDREMSKRCHHEPETKDGYPDDIICLKCQTIWHISDYLAWTAIQLQHNAPLFVRKAVLERQVKEINQ